MPSALAVFACRPNSHPFQERHVYLDEPVKIGRSVARCRPAQNNATFDCKVLSRNHALVWFDHKTGKVRHWLFPLLVVFSLRVSAGPFRVFRLWNYLALGLNIGKNSDNNYMSLYRHFHGAYLYI